MGRRWDRSRKSVDVIITQKADDESLDENKNLIRVAHCGVPGA